MNIIEQFNERELEDRGHITTELSNPLSDELDTLTIHELVELFNEQDNIPQKSVRDAIPLITKAIEGIVNRLQNGGRLFYIGAGTSGRLGVLDSSECPPTFCTPPDLVQGIIAGGDRSLRSSSESLEDDEQLSIIDLSKRNFGTNDCLVGITSGGTTPYVISAINYANKVNAFTVSISCIPINEVKMDSQVDIRLLTGPELLTGSTRLKAGTATKMALNIISTVSMIQLGKVYRNKMVDISVTNKKLLDRAIRILIEILDISREEAYLLLKKTDGSVKKAILISMTSVDIDHAETLLQKSSNNLRKAIHLVNSKDNHLKWESN